MKTLVVYGTKYGCTERCAKLLSEKLEGNVDLCNVKVRKSLDISQYSKVVIGSSVYIGKIQKEVSDFCNNNLEALKKKRVGLFICCMRDGEIAEKEIIDSFPKELLKVAVSTDFFGGEFIFEKMSFLDRIVAKKVAKVHKDMSSIDEEKIIKFAKIMNNSNI